MIVHAANLLLLRLTGYLVVSSNSVLVAVPVGICNSRRAGNLGYHLQCFLFGRRYLRLSTKSRMTEDFVVSRKTLECEAERIAGCFILAFQFSPDFDGLE
jgi:hypothetical protein